MGGPSGGRLARGERNRAASRFAKATQDKCAAALLFDGPSQGGNVFGLDKLDMAVGEGDIGAGPAVAVGDDIIRPTDLVPAGSVFKQQHQIPREPAQRAVYAVPCGDSIDLGFFIPILTDGATTCRPSGCFIVSLPPTLLSTLQRRFNIGVGLFYSYRISIILSAFSFMVSDRFRALTSVAIFLACSLSYRTIFRARFNAASA